MKHALLSAAAGAVAATLIAGGVAWATIPAANGVINACYRVSEDDQKGQVRVVADATSCKSNEARISWNQVGAQGERGPQGEQGIQGPAGRDGVDGANGADGEAGVSVTSGVEPAGVNCANGGSRFTATNGVTFACNGAGTFSAWEIRTGIFGVFSDATRTGVVTCSPGKNVLGGGVNHLDADPVEVLESHPEGSNQWVARVRTTSPGGTGTFDIRVICAKIE